MYIKLLYELEVKAIHKMLTKRILSLTKKTIKKTENHKIKK